MNAALKAKLEFIQTKYDFTTNVNVLHSEDFRSLISTNDMVSIENKNFLQVFKFKEKYICRQIFLKEKVYGMLKRLYINQSLFLGELDGQGLYRKTRCCQGRDSKVRSYEIHLLINCLFNFLIIPIISIIIKISTTLTSCQCSIYLCLMISILD